MAEIIHGTGRPKAYVLSDGTKVPSVTTVLGRFKESGPLLQWAFRRGKEGAVSLYEERDRAADVGTLVHSWVEADICGKERQTCPDELRPAVESAYSAWCEWWEQSRLVIVATELPLLSEEHRFGGTLDAVARSPNGSLVLIDWKTGGGVYLDNLLQLAAYKELWDENWGAVKPDGLEDARLAGLIKGFHLCRFSKEHGDFEHRFWRDLDDAWRMYLYLLRAYEYDSAIKKRI